MNQPKHTPGPWDYDCDSGGCYFKLSAGEEAIIDGCGFCSTPTINSQANARLIAAAPELLEALKALEIAVTMGFPTAEILQDDSAIRKGIRAAIAKAEGSTHETP